MTYDHLNELKLETLKEIDIACIAKASRLNEPVGLFPQNIVFFCQFLIQSSE